MVAATPQLPPRPGSAAGPVKSGPASDDDHDGASRQPPGLESARSRCNAADPVTQRQRLRQAKDRINNSLLPDTDDVAPTDPKSRLDKLIEKSERAHAAAGAQLNELQATLLRAIDAAPARAAATAAQVQRLAQALETTLQRARPSQDRALDDAANDDTPAPGPMAVVEHLDRLCTLRTRVERARRALQDAMRWATMEPTVRAALTSADGDVTARFACATTLLADARADLNQFSAYLAAEEGAKRAATLDTLCTEVCAALTPHVESALVATDPTKLSESEPGLDVAQLFEWFDSIGHREAFVQIYCRVRMAELQAAVSSKVEKREGDTSVQVLLGDVMERDHAGIMLPHHTRRWLLLTFLDTALSTSSRLPFSMTPAHDLSLLHRIERIFLAADPSAGENPHHWAHLQHLVQPVLARLAQFPMRNEKQCTEQLRNCFSFATPAIAPLVGDISNSADELASKAAQLLDAWTTSIPDAVAVLESLLTRHAETCGPNLTGAVTESLERLWDQVATSTVQVLARVKQLDMLARTRRSPVTGATAKEKGPIGRGTPAAAAPERRDGFPYADTTPVDLATALHHDTVQRYILLLGHRGIGVLVRAVETVADRYQRLVQSAPALPQLLVDHLGALSDDESVAVSSRVPDLHAPLVQMTHAAMDLVLDYVYAPIAAALRTDLMGTLWPSDRAVAAARAARPIQSPSGQLAAMQARFASAAMVGPLPQFSRSPSAAASAIGEYILQLPHHLDAFAVPVPVPVPTSHTAHALAFDEDKVTVMETLLIPPTSGSLPAATATLHAHDFLQALVLLAQADVLAILHARATWTAVPPAATPTTPSSPPGAATSPVPTRRPSSPPERLSRTNSLTSSASTGRLATLSSAAGSALAGAFGLAPSGSVTRGLAALAEPRANTPKVTTRVTSPTGPAAPAAEPVPVDADVGAQLALDLAYLGNIFNALDCLPLAEFKWAVAILQREETATELRDVVESAIAGEESGAVLRVAHLRTERVARAVLELVQRAPRTHRRRGSRAGVGDAGSGETPRLVEWWREFTDKVGHVVPRVPRGDGGDETSGGQ
ncbi:hypothetical protein GGF31_001807 [Allomyces arbusculus]|nr:hypothetical protein GGF31_001807 [Allomyces arbusculus]